MLLISVVVYARVSRVARLGRGDVDGRSARRHVHGHPSGPYHIKVSYGDRGNALEVGIGVAPSDYSAVR